MASAHPTSAISKQMPAHPLADRLAKAPAGDFGSWQSVDPKTQLSLMIFFKTLTVHNQRYMQIGVANLGFSSPAIRISKW
jgi:hypothetical protein